jgi:hypothetical protein
MGMHFRLTRTNADNTPDEETRASRETRKFIPIEETETRIPLSLRQLPPHLRDAAVRSWLAREEDYRYLAEH